MCWDENIPPVPTNRRSQFYLRHDDGAYKYGYDSGDGIAAKQVSSADNQVEGFYTFTNADGKLVNVKYTAGVQGFRPETSPVTDHVQSRAHSDVQTNSWSSPNPHQHQDPHQHHSPLLAFGPSQAESNANSEASYKISYNTGEHAREESSDSAGNVQRKYSDDAGQHDLSFIDGPNIGFQVVGGSLSLANGLPNTASLSKINFQQSSNVKTSPQLGSKAWMSPAALRQRDQTSSDQSYSFSYNTGDHARTELSDQSGNVQGRYSYSDEVGHHDLSYVAGGDSGFVVTGGSLSQPSGLTGQSVVANTRQNSWTQTPIRANAVPSFNHATPRASNQAIAYHTDTQYKQESGDTQGHVIGSYTVQTDGSHQQVNFGNSLSDGRVNQVTNFDSGLCSTHNLKFIQFESTVTIAGFF